MASEPQLGVQLQVSTDAWAKAIDAVAEQMRTAWRQLQENVTAALNAVTPFMRALERAYPATMANPEHLAAVRQLDRALVDAQNIYAGRMWAIRRQTRAVFDAQLAELRERLGVAA